MDHYFCIRSDGIHYVAAVQPTEPKDGDKLHPLAIVIGTCLIKCLENPNDFRAWSDLMARTSDQVVRAYIESTGAKVTESETVTIIDRIPKVN